MEVFRISKNKYINDLSGTGSRLNGGRWNSKGMSVVYTSSYRSLSVLELLVHVPQKNLTNDYQIATIYIPKDIKIKVISVETLPGHWRTIPINPPLQYIGDQWITEGKYCLLQIPSVIIPQEWNYVINPTHPQAKDIKIINTENLQLDERFIES